MLALIVAAATLAAAAPPGAAGSVVARPSVLSGPPPMEIGSCVWTAMGPERQAEVVSAIGQSSDGWAAVYGVVGRPGYPLLGLAEKCDPMLSKHAAEGVAAMIGGLMKQSALVSLADRKIDEAKLKAAIASEPEVSSDVERAASAVIRNSHATPVDWDPLLKAMGLKPSQVERAGSSESYVADWAEGAALEIVAAKSVAAAAEIDPRPLASLDEPMEMVRGPSSGQIVNAYPAAAAMRGVAGEVTVICALTRTGETTHCRLLSEEPSGYGFGNASLSVAGLFTFRAASGHSPAGRVVTIPIHWRIGG